MNIFFKGTFFHGTQLKQSNFTLNQVILLFFLLIGQRIPAKFARTYIKEKQCKASLRVSDGRSWYVQYKVRGMQDVNQQAEFTQGWSIFRRENNLEVGDVCVFELTKGNEISFKVSIFRIADEADNNMSIGEEKKKKKNVYFLTMNSPAIVR